MSNLPRLGRYELIRKIAAGGMAEIFLARQWGAGGFFRDVVVKRLFRHLAEPRHHVRFTLRAGDVLFYDNHRMLHGRTPFEGERWVRGVYFDAEG